ncbi:YfcC family protein [Sutcliffiella cohnii]
MRKFLKVPHTFVLLFAIIVIVAVATHIIPAGQFERVENPNTGVMEVDADSFQYIEQNPVGFTDIFKAVPEGMNRAAWVIFLIFMIGGAFGMINGTGAVNAGITRAVTVLQNREVILIPAVMFIFALGGATFGMAESTLVFIPIGVLLARKLGMDAVAGMGMVALGAASGFVAGVMNPFTVGVAQGIAELPLFSGIGLRLVILVVFVAIASTYIVRYGRKVQKDPTKSVVYELEKQVGEINKEVAATLEDIRFTGRHKLVLLVLILGFGLIIYGVFNGWSTSIDITATFIAMGIFAGLVGGSRPSKLAEDFIEGAKALTYGALIVGLAHGILVVLTNGQIIDTIIYGVASAISHLPAAFSAAAMFIVQLFINFIIPSGSGQAAATIPIMVPIGELVGISRQSVVLAYQLGDGISNYLFPTSAILMAGLSLANIPYVKWVKWVLPLIAMWFIASILFMMISVWIGYGPF